MKRRMGLATLMMATLYATGFPADAAMLTSAGGQVRVDDGHGYRSVPNVTKVEPGNRIFVGKNTTAILHYPNGCTVTIAAGRRVIVTRQPTCSNASRRPWSGRSGTQNARSAPDPTLALVGGAAVAAGLIVAATRHRSNGASP